MWNFFCVNELNTCKHCLASNHNLFGYIFHLFSLSRHLMLPLVCLKLELLERAPPLVTKAGWSADFQPCASRSRVELISPAFSNISSFDNNGKLKKTIKVIRMQFQFQKSE
mmetsp:Transcript_24062/g.31082  ORF Transcript_24062/g.31082 Transcript_24062/m.31082 type:complete len:111 (+) Transcript_24062:77-409(+)